MEAILSQIFGESWASIKRQRQFPLQLPGTLMRASEPLNFASIEETKVDSFTLSGMPKLRLSTRAKLTNHHAAST